MRAGATRRDARVVVAVLTGLLVGAAAGGGAVYLFGGKRVARPDVAPAGLAKADELALVPADAAGFLHFRAAEAWRHPALAGLKTITDKAGADAHNALDQTFTPPPSTLERVTVVMIQLPGAAPAGGGGRAPGPPPGGDGPGKPGGGDGQPKGGKGGGKEGGKFGGKGGPGGPVSAPPSPPPPPETVLVLAFSAPVDVEKAVRANLPGGSKRFLLEDREMWGDATNGLYFPSNNDKVMVIGSAKGVQAFATRSNPRPGPLSPALKLAADGTRHVVGGLNFKDGAATDALRKLIPEDFKPALGPVFRADALTGSLVFDAQNTKLEVRLAFPDAAAAAKANDDLRKAAATGRKALEEPRKKLEEELRGRDGNPRPFTDLPAAGGAVFALGLLNLVDDLLKEPPLAVEGNEVVATVVMPSLGEMSMASGGVVLGATVLLFSELRAASGPGQPQGPTPFPIPEVGEAPPGPGAFDPAKKPGFKSTNPDEAKGPAVAPMPKPKLDPDPGKKPDPEKKPEPKPKGGDGLDALREFGIEPPKK